jgi:hypothetical protein
MGAVEPLGDRRERFALCRSKGDVQGVHGPGVADAVPCPQKGNPDVLEVARDANPALRLLEPASDDRSQFERVGAYDVGNPS